MALRDQPYIPFYVKDFSSDEDLRECDAEATGVFIRIMCLMHKSKTYGKLLLEQHYQQTYQQILQQNPQHGSEICSDFVGGFAIKLLKHLPYDMLQIQRGLCQLITHDVCQIEGNYLCQRRMVKDGIISEKRADAGRKSAAGKGGVKNFVGTKAPTKKSTKREQITAYAYGNANSVDIEGVSNNTRGGTGEENSGGEKEEMEINFNLHEQSEIRTIEFTKDDVQMLLKAPDYFKTAWLDWLNYLAVEHKKELKSFIAKNAAYEGLMKISNYDYQLAEKIIRQSIARTWTGFFELKKDIPHTTKSNVIPIASSTDDIDQQIKNETDPEKRMALRKKKYGQA